jgi:transposase-like protein
MKRYTENDKRNFVARLINENKSALQLSKETNISQSTLLRWLREYNAEQVRQTKGSTDERFNERERLEVTFKTLGMNDEQLETFLTSKGISRNDLAVWRNEANKLLNKKTEPIVKREDPAMEKILNENANLQKELKEVRDTLHFMEKLLVKKMSDSHY